MPFFISIHTTRRVVDSTRYVKEVVRSSTSTFSSQNSTSRTRWQMGMRMPHEVWGHSQRQIRPTSHAMAEVGLLWSQRVIMNLVTWRLHHYKNIAIRLTDSLISSIPIWSLWVFWWETKLEFPNFFMASTDQPTHSNRGNQDTSAFKGRSLLGFAGFAGAGVGRAGA